MERDNMMHGARTALNQNQEIRDWAENFLKARERETKPELTDEEFNKHWRYVRPERMHEGAAAAVQAYKNRNR